MIKTLNAIAQNRSDFRQLKDDFLNEAHTLASFQHDNIVKIYPKGFTEQGDELWCMVMEFIEGNDLEEYIEKNEEISENDAIALITKVGKALAYIHQSSYVHRDIKPSNIMLRDFNLLSPVLIDFGLAREFDPKQSLTMDNRLTEHFAPLEQYNLDSYARYIDLDISHYRTGTWTDVYALAATLYNLLTHDSPMPAPMRSLSPKNFKSPKQLNPKISDRTNAAILKGMSLNPQERSQTIPEWLDLISGKVLNNGLYCLKEPLNQNHMCKNAYDFSDEYNIVYKAIETKSQTPVIIKTLSKEALTSSLNSDLTLEKAIAYLRNEAKLTQEIRQYNIPNIVRFRDYFEEFGIPYLILEFIEGENLFSLVERSGKLSEDRAVKYIKQIASALLICHKHKIYHRDINPDNIIIRSQDDQAILIDFDVSSNSELTGNNFFRQPQSINKKNSDTDLYSLAATLYYLVTEVNPSGGLHDLAINKWFDYSHEKLKNPKTLNSNLSEHLDLAIVEGMKLESGDRLWTIREWLEFLEPTLEKTSKPDLDKIEDWMNLGLKQVSAGEFRQAIASWEKALDIEPNLSEVWHNKGSALGRLEKYEEAVKCFDKALKIDTNDYQTWNDRAHALYKLQNWQAAADSWKNAIEINPDNHIFWYNRGCALEQLGIFAESIENYQKTLELKSDFEPARSRLTALGET